MSRIILSRHDNGEEHITIGFDRPLQHFFWSECDSDGESVDESYIDRGLTPRTTKDFYGYAATHNEAVHNAMAFHEGKLVKMLERHSTLEYPESNVTVDLSHKE